MNRTRILVTTLALVVASSYPGMADPHAAASADVKVQPAAKEEVPAPDSDAAVIAAQLPTYPLETCVVSGKKLGAMGDPVDLVHEGRLVRLCCPMCEGGFKKEPAKYLAKIDAAVVEQQLPSYPLGVCPVSGRELGGMGEPYNYVYGTRLVRFCCGGCVDAFNEDPAAYLAKIDAVKVEGTAADE